MSSQIVKFKKVKIKRKCHKCLKKIQKGELYLYAGWETDRNASYTNICLFCLKKLAKAQEADKAVKEEK